jgi:hypothetical protein
MGQAHTRRFLVSSPPAAGGVRELPISPCAVCAVLDVCLLFVHVQSLGLGIALCDGRSKEWIEDSRQCWGCHAIAADTRRQR